MGILHFHPGKDDGQVEEAGTIDAMSAEKRKVNRLVLVTVLLVCLFLGLLIVSSTSYDWYVADVDWTEQPDMGFTRDHFGLVGEAFETTVEGEGNDRWHYAYEDFLEGSHEVVALNMRYILIAIMSSSLLFIFTVGRIENLVRVGGNRWSFLFPTIVGSISLLLLVGGMLYFYISFEDGLASVRGDEVDWTTASYGWPMGMLFVAGVVMFIATAIAHRLAWRAMEVRDMAMNPSE